MAAWLPTIAPRTCCSSGGGGCRAASWQVNSYMGSDFRSRVAWYSAMAASNGRAPLKVWSSAVTHSSASRKASLIPWAVMGSLL
jgi:hypothetical protein